MCYQFGIAHMPAHFIQLRLAVVALLALLAASNTTRADIITIGDTELPGRFTGSVEVKNQTTTSAVIEITLTNTSPVANGGYITGFAFNNPGLDAQGNISGVNSFGAAY